MFGNIRLTPAIGLGVVLGAFVVMSLRSLDVPGLYMDSVNPDYLSVYMLYPDRVPAWIYPDNLLFKLYRYPVLNSLYGGATPAYLAIPYNKLFGYGVANLRLFHIVMASAIIAIGFWTIYRLLGDAVMATLATLAFALDPTFVFAWRSQFWLQLFPMLTFLPGLWFLARAVASPDTAVDRRALAIGAALCGFGAWGYWVYALYGTALFLFVIACRWRHPKVALISAVVFGTAFLVGYLPFIYGHLSIVHEVGINAYLKLWTDVQNAYGVNVSADGFLVRLHHVAEQILHLPDGTRIALLMLGNIALDPSAFLAQHGITMSPRVVTMRLYGGRLIAFLALCSIAALAVAWFRRREKEEQPTPVIASPEAAIVSAFLAVIALMHIVFGLAIGRSLWLQHYIALLPLAYFGCFLGIDAVTRRVGAIALRGRRIVCAIVVLAMLAVHIPQNFVIYRLLAATGGRGLWSDAINRVASHAYELPADAVMVFSQWGYWMGMAMASGATRPIWQSTTVDGMIEVIKQRPPQRTYALVINTDVFAATVTRVEAETGLKLESARPFTNRVQEPAVTVGLFRRP